MKKSELQKLSWTTIAGIYLRAKPGSRTRKQIHAECRRCGYTPRVIIGLNAEQKGGD